MRFAKDIFKKAVARLGYDIRATPRSLILHRQSLLDADLDLVFSHYFLRKANIFFVQIGACDGLFADKFYKHIVAHDLKGILIEPQIDMFAALQQTHAASSNLVLLNLAIAESAGSKSFYRIKSRYLPLLPNARGLSSFRKESIERAVRFQVDEHPEIRKSLPVTEELIESQEIECSTLNQILENYHVNSLDVLLIDTEGYDFEIVKTIDFKKIRPAIIQLEHSHLSVSDTNDCYELLIRHDYLLARGPTDTVAYLRAAMDLPLPERAGSAQLRI